MLCVAKDLNTQILISIRDEIRGVKQEQLETNERLEGLEHGLGETNQRLAVLAKITQGIDTRLTRMESQNVFLPRRVDVLEEKVARLEENSRPRRRRRPT